jgi:hypothetical protein
MSTLANNIFSDHIVKSVYFSNSMVCLVLTDGREIKTPIEFYPRLAAATTEQLKNFRLMGGGRGIHWEDLDEDLSVESIVLGRHAHNKA